MRIKVNQPKLGDTRYKTKFAWLPTLVDNSVGGGQSIIWLEKYTKKQVYKQSYTYLGWYLAEPEDMWVTTDKYV